jgi:hypothetical protein
MLTTLPTVKARLEIPSVDISHDDMLTSFIAAVSAHFEKKCNRIFARAEFTEEFPADQTEILPAHYPLGIIEAFELKTTEAEGWVTADNVEYLVRRSCVISLSLPIGTWRQQARVTFFGGYTCPDNPNYPNDEPLPDDLQQAAVEQVAAWFLNRDKLSLVRHWPHGGVYQVFSQLPLLPQVETVLQSYKRWSL